MTQSMYTPGPPLPKFWGYLCLYQNLKVTPFLRNEGNDDPIMYGTIAKVIFYHLFEGIYKEVDPDHFQEI
jgi:hypothetical protein